MSSEKLRPMLLLFFVAFVSSKVNAFLEGCPKPLIRKSSIIKTHESIANGATFLGKITMVSSKGCHEQCCEKEGCNLVMLKYGEGRKVDCFMFNCHSPSRCSFTLKDASKYGHYAALDYTKNFHHNEDRKLQEETTESPTEPPTEPPTTQAPRKSYKVGKWGNVNWFEPTTTTKPQYNRGYDSSEKNWVDKTAQTTHNAYETGKTKPAKHWNISPSKNDDDTTKYGSFDHKQDQGNITPEKPTVNPTTSDWEDFPRRVFVDNNPDFPNEPKSHQKKPVDKPSGHPKPAEPTVSDVKTPSDGTEPITKSPVRNVVIRRLNIQENKAVIPLAVGLVLALLLLMAVIFRVKTSRRRRTKAFLTDDADYLINGMYL